MNEDPMLQAGAQAPEANTLGSFTDVYNVWRDAQKSEPVFASTSMPEFAKIMYEQTGDQSYLAGAEDSRLKRTSAAIDRTIKPVTDVTASAGKFLGGLIGPKSEQFGEEMGRSLPRGMVDTTAAIAGGALMMAPEPTMATKVAGAGLLGLAGGDAFASTFEKTGSKALGAVSGLGMAALPGVAKFGENVAVKALLNSPLYKVTAQGAHFPLQATSKAAGLAERFGEYVGANTALTGLQEVQIQADSLITDGKLRPFDERHAMELVGSQLPFALVDLPTLAFTGKGGIERSRTSMTAARELTDEALREAKQSLGTYNKDRKALPAPPVVEDFVWQDGKQVKVKRTSNPFNLGGGEIKAPTSQYSAREWLKKQYEKANEGVPPEPVETNNNLAMNPDTLALLTDAASALQEKGQKTLTAGDLARRMKLKTPEETMALMSLLQKRGIISEEKQNGVHQILAVAPSEPAVLMEQIRTLFPKIHENLMRPRPVATPNPVTPTAAKPTMAQTMKAKVDEEMKSFAKPEEKPKDTMQSLNMESDIQGILAEDPDMGMPRAWAKLKQQNKSADYMEFNTAWRKMGRAWKPVQEELPGVPPPSDEPKFKFSETGLKGEQKPFKFDQARPAPTDEEAFISQVREVSKFAPEAMTLIMHPNEMLLMKAKLVENTRRFLKEVYTSRNVDSKLDVADMPSIKALEEFDIQAAATELEARGHAPDEVVRLVSNQIQNQLGNLAYERYKLQEHVMDVSSADKLKEFKEVKDRIDRLHEVYDKMDPEFKAEETRWREQIAENARQNALYDKLRAKNHSAEQVANRGARRVTEIPNRPDNPNSVIIRARNWMDEMESRGRRRGEEKASDTESYGPADFVFSEAVRFYEDKQTHMADWAKRHHAEGKFAPHELELQALEDFLKVEPMKRAARIADKVKRRQVALESGRSFDEDAEDALYRERSKKGGMENALREQNDLAAMVDSPEDSSAELHNRRVIMASFPSKMTHFIARKVRKAMGKATDTGIDNWVRDFNTAYQAFQDGVFELRPTNKAAQAAAGVMKRDRLRVRPESGMRYRELAGLFNKSDDATQRWLNDEFLPALQHIRDANQKEVEAKRDPKSLWAMPTFKFSRKTDERGEVDPIGLVNEDRYLADSLSDTTKYFQQYFLSKGYDPEAAGRLTSVARKITAAFDDQSNPAAIVKLVGDADDYFGVAWPKQKVIGLNPTDTFYQRSINTWAQMVTLGHEFTHLKEDDRAYKMMKSAVETMTTEERHASLGLLFQASIPKSMQDERVTRYFKHRLETSVNAEEYISDVAGMYAAGLFSASSEAHFKDLVEHGQFAPGFTQDFVNGMFANLADMSDGISSYLTGQGINADRFKMVSDRVKKYIKSQEEVKAIEAQWTELMNNTKDGPIYAIGDPDRLRFFNQGLGSAKFSTIDRVKDMMGLNGHALAEKHLGVEPGFLARTFMPMFQFAEMYPQLRPVADLGYEYLSLARKAQTKILEPFLTEGVLGKSQIDYAGTGVTKVLRNKGALEAFNLVGLIKNERMQADPKFLVLTDAEMRSFMPDVPKALQDNVISMHRALEKAAPIAAGVLVDGRYNQLGLFAARAFLGANSSVGSKIAAADGQAFVNAIRSGLATDPNLPVKYGTGYTTAVSVLMGSTPGTGLMDKVKNLETQLAGRPSWLPEVRLGKYMVAWKDGAVGFDREIDAINYAEKQNAKGIKTRTWKKSVKNDESQGMHPLLINHFREMEEAGYKAAMAAQVGGNTALYDQLMEAYKPGEATWKDYLGKGFTANLLPRKLKEGREEVDLFRGFIQYVAGVTNGVARDHVKHTMALLESDDILKSNPSLAKTARDHIQTMIYPSTREMSKLKNFNFLWFMGGNVSSMMLEASQSLMTVAPHFIQATNNVPLTYKTMLGVGKSIAKSWAKDKGAFTKDENLALKRGGEEGVVDFGVLGDFYEAEDLSVVNLKKLTGGDDNFVTKAADLTKRAGYMYAHWARSMYSQVSRVNNQIAFLTAFRLAQDGKIPNVKRDFESSYAYAKQATPTATYTGGQAARPVGLFANSGKFFGAVGAMYSLQSYSYAALANVGRLMAQSIDKQRLTAPERAAARKALGHMLTAQMAMGGAMGMPFAGALTALVEQVFGTSVKPSLESAADSVAAMVTDDEDAQDLISDVGMRGVAGRFIGADVSSRVSLGNVLGVDSYNGFSLNSLVGPVGSVFRGFMTGGQKLAEGDPGAAVEAMIPRAYKNVVDIARHGDQVRDNQGRLIMTATPGEQARMLLGFKPSRLANYHNVNSMVRQSEVTSAREHSRWLEETAQKMLTNQSPDEVRAMIFERAKEFDMNPRTLAQRVVETAQELTLPHSPLDDGSLRNARERQAITASFRGVIPERVQETKKLQQRASLEQWIGIPGGGRLGNREMQRAARVDALLAQNPTLSRQQASLMVERQMNPRGQAF